MNLAFGFLEIQCRHKDENRAHTINNTTQVCQMNEHMKHNFKFIYSIVARIRLVHVHVVCKHTMLIYMQLLFVNGTDYQNGTLCSTEWNTDVAHSPELQHLLEQLLARIYITDHET